MADAQETIHQIEYRWDDRRDLSPVASTMSLESLRAWDSQIRGWVRHPHADRLWESFCYQVLPTGRAALAWRYDWQAAEREDGTRGRPLVSRVLAGLDSLLTPEVAIALCHIGLPATAGPPPGKVTAQTRLSVINAAELSGLVHERATKLDMEAAQQEGLRQVIAAAVASPHIPLAISIRDPHILRAPAEGLQWRLLWGLRRIVWPVLGTTGRGWSFSTFEPPLGDVDSATLPDILFRQAQDAPLAAPARPRDEVKIRLLDPAALDAESYYTEMAGWLVDEYKERGGDELKQLVAEWCRGEQSQERQIDRVHGELSAMHSPAVVFGPPASYVALSSDRATAREPAPQQTMAESDESAAVEPAGSLPVDGGLPRGEEAPLHQTPPPADEGAPVSHRSAPTAAEDDPVAQGPAPADLVAEGADPHGSQGDPIVQSPALASGQAGPRHQATDSDEALDMPVIAQDQQAHERQTEALAATGHDRARDSEQDWFWDQLREQGPQPSDHGEHAGSSQYFGAHQHADAAQEHKAAYQEPRSPDYPAAPGDIADPEHGGDFPDPGMPAQPPHPDPPSQPSTQHPAGAEPIPVTWTRLQDDLLGPAPREASPPPPWGQNQQPPADRWPQSPFPAQQSDTVSHLLKMLPMATDENQFWSILLAILRPGIPPDDDRVRARREVSKPEWYGQIDPRFKYMLGANSLSDIFQKIIVPDLNNPHVVAMITEWAVDKNPFMIGGLLAAASRTDDETWQLVVQILQSRLAYRWTIETLGDTWTTENLGDTLWNPARAPHPDSDPGRGLRGRRRKK